jgi:hypothetical protein
MENAALDIASAKSGVIQSYLQPLDRAFPMISSDDVGRAAAALLQERWDGKRVVELEGQQRISPNALWPQHLPKRLAIQCVARWCRAIGGKRSFVPRA